MREQVLRRPEQVVVDVDAVQHEDVVEGEGAVDRHLAGIGREMFDIDSFIHMARIIPIRGTEMKTLDQYDMILYMYFVLKIAGSDWALCKMILEMIKYFTLPI